MVSLEFLIDYGPGVDPDSNRNKYQEYFPVVKGGRCVGQTTLPPSCVDCLEIWSLSLLEPSGPVWACNGIALLLVITSKMPRLSGFDPC